MSVARLRCHDSHSNVQTSSEHVNDKEGDDYVDGGDIDDEGVLSNVPLSVGLQMQVLPAFFQRHRRR